MAGPSEVLSEKTKLGTSWDAGWFRHYRSSGACPKGRHCMADGASSHEAYGRKTQ